MHFLRKLDELKSEYIYNNMIKFGSQFYYYKYINFEESLCSKLNNKFMLLKRYNTNILISYGDTEIKVYLSDYDIITILVDLLNEYTELANIIIDKLVEFIENKTYKYTIDIDKHKFSINGILLFDDTEIYINTKADFRININEFIMLINLILEKERISGEYVVEGTICKYILISKYYSNICDVEEKNKIGEILSEHGINITGDLESNKFVINKTKQSRKYEKEQISKLLIPYEKFKEYNTK